MITFGEYFKRREQGETVKAIAKALGVSNKAINRRLNEAGYVAENNEWTWRGEGEEPLTKEMVFAQAGQSINQQKRDVSKRTDERKNETAQEPTNETTKEKKHSMRKRASFDIDKELLKELKIFAIKEEKNAYEIVEQAIKEHLRRKK